MSISIHNITTNSGRLDARSWKELAPFLTDEQLEEVDSIGYTGKTKDGKETTLLDYLNSLDENSEYDIKQTKYDNGDFTQKYMIARCVHTKKSVTV